MLDKRTVETIIEDCLLRIELFNARHDGRAKDKVVTVRTIGTDGGGMSTYGLTYIFGPNDHYECHDEYLYIHRETECHDWEDGKKKRTESVAFIPYSGIVAIECSPKAYI